MTLIRNRGRIDYSSCIESMQALTDTRDEQTADEIWLVEHPPVYTLGLNGDRAHVLDPGDIPVVQTDRGGQVTYHGPGQLVVYTLLDLRRAGIGIRALVSALEDAVVDLAAGYGIDAAARPDAPGVYVDGAKLASVGLRVRRHCSYHGLALNVSMDTRPFARINPCGFAGLRVTQLDELGAPTDLDAIGLSLVERLVPALGLDSPTFIDSYA